MAFNMASARYTCYLFLEKLEEMKQARRGQQEEQGDKSSI